MWSDWSDSESNEWQSPVVVGIDGWWNMLTGGAGRVSLDEILRSFEHYDKIHEMRSKIDSMNHEDLTTFEKLFLEYVNHFTRQAKISYFCCFGYEDQEKISKRRKLLQIEAKGDIKMLNYYKNYVSEFNLFELCIDDISLDVFEQS